MSLLKITVFAVVSAIIIEDELLVGIPTMIGFNTGVLPVMNIGLKKETGFSDGENHTSSVSLTNFRRGAEGFSGSVIKQCGKRYAKVKSDEDLKQFKEWLDKNYSEDRVKRDFQPAAINNIVATSRPISEWGYVKLSKAVQCALFKLKPEDLPKSKEMMNEASQLSFLVNYGIKLEEFDFGNPGSKGAAQGRNAIFKNNIARYNGVLIKVEKYNEKIKNRPDKEPKTAINENGYLAQPPGIDSTIYGYQNCDLRPLTDKNILVKIGYPNYCRKPEDIIQSSKRSERLKIQPGSTGYIRNKDQVVLYQQDTRQFRSARRRQPISERRDNPLLFIADFGKDWIVFDARGMLRNVYYRRLAKPGTLTIAELAQKFSGDIVIDPSREVGQVRICYSEENSGLSLPTRRVMGHKGGHKKLLEMTKEDDVALVSIDLGQTNPIAGETAVLRNEEGEMKCISTENFVLSKDRLEALQKIRAANDELEETIKTEAIEALPDNFREEVRAFESVDHAAKVKEALITEFNIPHESFNKITPRTTVIADFLAANGKDDLAFFMSGEKKLKKRDAKFAKEMKGKLSEEARKSLNDLIWEKKRKDPRYKKIAKRKMETIRASINSLVKDVANKNGLEVVVNIEDLQIGGGFFDGNGKSEASWEGLFKPRKDNRWFVNGYHKHLTELAMHKGVMVIESCASYTSQTCVKCEHCCRENRNGEVFRCLKCGHTANTDVEIAPANLRRIVMRGKKLPGPERSERSGGEKNLGTNDVDL
ncbi:unnamed protein product [Sphagnum jensenii]